MNEQKRVRNELNERKKNKLQKKRTSLKYDYSKKKCICEDLDDHTISREIDVDNGISEFMELKKKKNGVNKKRKCGAYGV